MKRIAWYGVLCTVLFMSMGFVFNACVDNKEEALGSIFGIVTKEGTNEVMQAIGIELYLGEDRLLSTTTFSDGHYEFPDLKAGRYLLRIVAKGFEETEYSVLVESGRQARQDMQVVVINLHMTVRTMNATDQSGSTATLNGYVSYESSSYLPTEVGFYYSINNDPLTGTKVIGELEPVEKTFSAQISDLSYGKYYVQAYGRNSRGIAYGDIRTFEVTNYPVVRTDSATNILAETATLNGYIVSEGDPAYTERGFVYSKSYSTPTVDDPENATTKVVVPGTNREFSANVSSLSENTTYYIRAYATHAKGTVYGAITTIVPKAILPVVTTLEVTNILAESATLNGRIENVGEPPYTERGFIYSTSYRVPTLNDIGPATVKVEVDGTSVDYSANLSSLVTGMNYYVRAYAISPKGVVYGDTIVFSPKAILPVVVTLNVTNILAESATLNGRIDDGGEPPYIEKGFLYSSTYVTPTINDPESATVKVVVSGSEREFSANINAMTTGSIYYVCAYAVSSKGVSYGTVVTFKPQSAQYVIIEDSHLMVMREDLAKSATWSQAVELCENSSVGGYTDWRLPTRTETNILASHVDEIGGFDTGYYYWTSVTWSSYYSNYAYIYYFENGEKYENLYDQGNSYRVRAVRSIP